MQEQIFIQKFTTGTTLTYFTTFSGVSAINNANPSFLVFNNQGLPDYLNTFSGNEVWSRTLSNGYYNYVMLSSITSNFITGYSIVTSYDNVLIPSKIQELTQDFVSNIDLASSGTGINYVFTSSTLVEDSFITVSMHRSFDTLDTLKIYNNAINSFPEQESDTGVVFGKLIATQNVFDENGNRVQIPLRNVSVGIFNPTNEFPDSSTINSDGNRQTYTLRESANLGEYFNSESFNYDRQLLRSGSIFSGVPEEYKYITRTNDEGEFVLYDVPVGSQLLLYEIDLFKQGLTRDEIQLNRFVFPPTQEITYDGLPSLVLDRIPIDVIPAWGLGQSGYTEIRALKKLDLRKWSTYIFPPVSFEGKKLEEIVAIDSVNTLKMKVRDMSKLGYPDTQINLVTIPDDLDRVPNQQFNWNNELQSISNAAQFARNGCSVIKLPGNLYDPNAFKTDQSGNTTNQKGVWLTAYQVKVFINESGSYRATGGFTSYSSALNGFYNLNHFDLNYVPANFDTLNAPSAVGVFPYEKPWTLSYPEPYSIPKKPVSLRYQGTFGRLIEPVSGKYYMQDPAYSDGDLVGAPVFQGIGGFGIQKIPNGGISINRIARVATKSYMYKYERGVAYNEKYANGYEPAVNPSYLLNGLSSVQGGEKYQRLEAGYGYFMKPEAWPRVVRNLSDQDSYLDKEIVAGTTESVLQAYNGDLFNPGPGLVNTPFRIVDNFISIENNAYYDVYNLDLRNLSASMDSRNTIKQGGVDIYRVISSELPSISAQTIPTFVTLYCSGDTFDSASRCKDFRLTNDGQITVDILNKYNAPIFKNGTGSPIPPFSIVTLQPGEYFTALSPSPPSGGINDYVPSAKEIIQWTGIELPANADFNLSTSAYDKIKYTFYVKVTKSSESIPNDADSFNIIIDKTVSQLLPSDFKIYLKTSYYGGPSGYVGLGINSQTGGGSLPNNPNNAFDNAYYDALNSGNLPTNPGPVRGNGIDYVFIA